MKWYQDYDFFFEQFDRGDTRLDETVFYFSTDPLEVEHYIGYLPEYDKPYWAGYCDVPNGCDFQTAKELFEAKIYDGKSIRERWSEIVFTQIGGVHADDWDKSWFDVCKKDR